MKTKLKLSLYAQISFTPLVHGCVNVSPYKVNEGVILTNKHNCADLI